MEETIVKSITKHTWNIPTPVTRQVFMPVNSATWYSFYNPCKHAQVSALLSFVVVITLVVRLFSILLTHSELLSHWERILLVYSLFQLLISGQFLCCEIWKFLNIFNSHMKNSLESALDNEVTKGSILLWLQTHLETQISILFSPPTYYWWLANC